MAETVEFLTAADLRDTRRASAAVSLLRGKCDHTFRLTTAGAVGHWNDFAGNTCHFLFHPRGSVILGFDHESPMSPHAFCTDDFRAWPSLYDSLPAALATAIRADPFAPDFDLREVTFCLWNESATRTWQKGDIEYPEREYGDPDGQSYILSCLEGYAQDFAGEFSDLYRWQLDSRAVAEMLSGDEITWECVRWLSNGSIIAWDTRAAGSPYQPRKIASTPNNAMR